MHTFLRAVGFKNINNRKALDKLLNEVLKNPDRKKQYRIDEGEDFTEILKYFGNGFGILIRGIYDENRIFHIEHYFPILEGEIESVEDELTISKKSENRAFSVMCDDVRLGVLLIFYLQNSIDYIKSIEINENIPIKTSASLAALSIEGKIILPVMDNIFNDDERKEEHNMMIYDARRGNEEAIEKLAVEDIDIYMQVNERIKEEDIYSIVNTTFYPFGSESDNYSIVGTILDYSYTINSYSDETVCMMKIICNDIIFDLIINESDLCGMPMIGARFKGVIWMQGYVYI